MKLILSNVEARALLYQGILINSEAEPKLELTKILKETFIKEGIENAFKDELIEILKEINIDKIPSNYTYFYNEYINEDDENLTKIKINNKIIHQSKLINYFRSDVTKDDVEKDLNDLLKKVKKDKEYYISMKDIILIESLRYDGINISKKYNKLYKVADYNMPNDIQVLINNNESGVVLLRLVEVIGQDRLKDIGSETFISRGL